MQKGNTKKQYGMRIFWGLFFLLCAVGLLLSKLQPELDIWQGLSLGAIVILVVAAFIVIYSLVHRFFTGVWFPIAIVMIMLEDSLPDDLRSLIPWTVLAAALLLTIACEILFHRDWTKHSKMTYYDGSKAYTSEYSSDTTEEAAGANAANDGNNPHVADANHSTSSNQYNNATDGNIGNSGSQHNTSDNNTFDYANDSDTTRQYSFGENFENEGVQPGQGGPYTKYSSGEGNTAAGNTYLDIAVSFGGIVRYINEKNLEVINLKVTFGGAKVYFDNAELAGDTAVINVDMAFSGVELFVPSNWLLIDKLSHVLSGVDEKHARNIVKTKTVTLKGNMSLSGITVHYI
ncbi:MAG: hypothetical protein LBN22_08895 [Clostridiales Family XIII bacterium]|jgi:hypothetical protein|nr:hypothetical protein [Clostridiales Family XIII bacterium]